MLTCASASRTQRRHAAPTARERQSPIKTMTTRSHQTMPSDEHILTQIREKVDHPATVKELLQRLPLAARTAGVIQARFDTTGGNGRPH